ncbi:MAG: hypothetical protein FJ308_12375 [Planctomycetes bacterium]|nr:hypothetical protein [Planctomycetota bacterium]
MSRQSKNRTSNPSWDQASSRQPLLLAVMVFVGGAVSTWCWYRPLPKDATNVANGLVNVASGGDFPSKPESAAKSFWGLEGLVFPSLFSKNASEQNTRDDSGNKVVTGDAGFAELPGDLVGDQELQLTPYQRIDVPLKDRVAGEPLPIVPVQPPLHRGSPTKPPIWVDAEEIPGIRSGLVAGSRIDASAPTSTSQLVANSGDLDSPSPFRIPPRNVAPSSQPSKLADSRKWPDEGFEPSQLGTSFRADKGQFASGNKLGGDGLRTNGGNGPGAVAQSVLSGSIPNTKTIDRDRDGAMALSSNRIRTKEIEELEPSRDPKQTPASEKRPLQSRTPDPSNVIRQPKNPSAPKL